MKHFALIYAVPIRYCGLDASITLANPFLFFYKDSSQGDCSFWYYKSVMINYNKVIDYYTSFYYD